MKLRDFIIDNHAYALGIQADTYEDAIKAGVDLLIAAGTAEKRYYQSVLDIKQKHGPYYVIAPGIAMPHARPEDGAIDTGFALVTLTKPVAFGHPDNDPVDIILCISAKDKDDLNNNVIIDVMTLLENESIVDKIRAAKTEEDLCKIFDEVDAFGTES